jgi:hypothetical protein
MTTVQVSRRLETTPDYLFSLASIPLSVDSSLGSFFPVLPAPRHPVFFGTEVLLVLDALNDRALQFLYARLIALVKGPLLDALCAHESGFYKNFHVRAGCRLAHAQFLCDQHAAHAIVDEIAVYLGPEVFAGLLQPLQDLQPAVVGHGPQHQFDLHIDN